MEMELWIKILMLYGLAVILLGVGISETIRAKSYIKSMFYASSIHEQDSLLNSSTWALAIGAICIIVGTLLLAFAMYYPAKWVRSWCIRRALEHAERLEAENRQAAAEMNPINPVNEEQVPEQVIEAESSV